VWQPDQAATASLARPFGPLAMARRNGRKAEALGQNRPFTVHVFFYFQKLFFLKILRKLVYISEIHRK
jgi:hypothetical protein